jgi:Uma2 family endonuclease
MIYPLTKPIGFDEFINWYPDTSETHYELHKGAIIEMPKPRGQHSVIAGMLTFKLMTQIEVLALPYLIPKECIIKIGEDTGYEPDVTVLNRPSLINEPLWDKASTVTLADSIPLVIEVVSTNWRDDYMTKLSDYEALGITEYWIVDYLALGAKRYIGSPKQPTISIYSLVDDEYQVAQFQGNDPIQSSTFPELQLTATQFFAASA